MPHHHHTHDHSCNHDDDDHLKQGEGQQDILYGCIDREAVSALNEASPGSSKRIIKPYNERNDETLALASDADDQLILTIPFTGPVKLRTLLLKAGPGAQTPAKLHLYANKADLDFDDANAGVPKPTQSLESIAETREVVEYPLRAAKFPAVNSLTIFVPAASCADTTQLYYVGLRGEYWGPRAEAPTNIVYESAPQLKDHVGAGTETAANRLG